LSAVEKSRYFSGVNPDLLNWLPVNAAQVLEVGCGTGQLGRVFLSRNPLSRYLGIELVNEAAKQAEDALHHVITGDIEHPAILSALDQALDGTQLDLLIFGDVLEHLHDPWKILSILRQRMNEQGVCVACIPNVAHWSLLQQQLRGRWDYSDAGLLDRTHLRFFTLHSAREMFQQAGWTVMEARPRILWPEQTEAALQKFAPLAAPLGIPPDQLTRDLSALQWVIRAVNGGASASRLHVAGLGLRKQAGVTDARIDYPLAALSSLPATHVTWGDMRISIPRDWEPGVLILQRQFQIDPEFNGCIERFIAKGWVVVQDMDDDPRYWKEFVESDFYAYRAVHAVTVSTPVLAELIGQWNPNVQIFQNAVFALPQIAPTTPKQGERIRVFFGAMNRGPDWSAIMQPLIQGVASWADRLEFVVVHDRMFFDALPERFIKTFHPTLSHSEYMKVLVSCDIALSPLNDTPFNRMKSDIKLIECYAAGVVPICSPVVYGESPIHRDIGIFAETAEDWPKTLIELCSNPDAIARHRATGLEYVRRNRMHSQQVKERELYYRWLFANRDALETQRQERLRLAQGL
jgi:2-polyprenyl-3-methyl-5-hydroxy-6-metoxy-1,4-benzoquinol methylase